MSTTPGICPSGYYPVPGDSSNCTNSTQTTIVKRQCPSGLVLQDNGLCGTNTATVSQTSAAYCGPQYATKNCVYTAQLTSALTPATGTESIPNTICAFTEGDAQFPCDPGCCLGQSTTKSGDNNETEATAEEQFVFPLWAIILLIVLSGIFLALVIYFATRKKKLTNSSNGRNNFYTQGASYQ
ncbi:hypothetical protein EBT25_03970 [bacterium]|nr:hypothetical protein [bacterium]